MYSFLIVPLFKILAVADFTAIGAISKKELSVNK